MHDGTGNSRGMKARFACQTEGCCRRGYLDMISQPRRHFVVQRINEVNRLSWVPERLRPRVYLEEFLRPATDSIIAAARIEPRLKRTQHALESWRLTLGEMMNSQHLPATTSVPARGFRSRHRIGA